MNQMNLTEEEKMLSGQVYNAEDPELIKGLCETRALIYEFNNLHPSKTEEMQALLRRILGRCGEKFLFNQPFRCDYGKNIRVGERFFANFNFTVLDEAYVTIGDDCFIGAGSVVTRDIPSGCVAVGNPARVIKKVGGAGTMDLKEI